MARDKTRYAPGIVANGYSNLVTGVEADARRIVEAKYADEWKAASPAGRLKLERIMSAEIKELAATLMPNVSPEAIF